MDTQQGLPIVKPSIRQGIIPVVECTMNSQRRHVDYLGRHGFQASRRGRFPGSGGGRVATAGGAAAAEGPIAVQAHSPVSGQFEDASDEDVVVHPTRRSPNGNPHFQHSDHREQQQQQQQRQQQQYGRLQANRNPFAFHQNVGQHKMEAVAAAAATAAAAAAAAAARAPAANAHGNGAARGLSVGSQHEQWGEKWRLQRQFLEQGGLQQQMQQPQQMQQQEQQWRHQQAQQQQQQTSAEAVKQKSKSSKNQKSTKTPSNTPDETKEPITLVNRHDVLFGRGPTIGAHAGNIFFRKLVMLKSTEYRETKPPFRRAVVLDVVSIVKSLTPPGRFLTTRGGKWYTINNEKLADKVNDAFKNKPRPEPSSESNDDSMQVSPLHQADVPPLNKESRKFPLKRLLPTRKERTTTTTDGQSVPMNRQGPPPPHREPLRPDGQAPPPLLTPPAAAAAAHQQQLGLSGQVPLNRTALGLHGQTLARLPGAAAAAASLVGFGTQPAFPLGLQATLQHNPFLGAGIGISGGSTNNMLSPFAASRLGLPGPLQRAALLEANFASPTTALHPQAAAAAAAAAAATTPFHPNYIGVTGATTTPAAAAVAGPMAALAAAAAAASSLQRGEESEPEQQRKKYRAQMSEFNHSLFGLQPLFHRIVPDANKEANTPATAAAAAPSDQEEEEDDDDDDHDDDEKYYEDDEDSEEDESEEEMERPRGKTRHRSGVPDSVAS